MASYTIKELVEQCKNVTDDEEQIKAVLGVLVVDYHKFMTLSTEPKMFEKTMNSKGIDDNELICLVHAAMLGSKDWNNFLQSLMLYAKFWASTMKELVKHNIELKIVDRDA